ncbi:MAG: hypothetical protein FWC39_01485 [Bacteroidetes bacterium]|nr:hypothetical protein [Bacteroidota bacterium]
MTKKILIIVVALSFISCDKENGNNTEIDKEQTAYIRANTVDTLRIGSNSLVLEAYLWRDFMPSSPPNGRPMLSINKIICTDMIKIPDNISMIKQYVFYDDEIWVANYENEELTPNTAEYEMERISINGPKWGPQIYVDVISQIHDAETNKDYYIEQKNVYVGRTD